MKIVITGGAGFIGSNTAFYYLNRGDEVIILDNFSRRGTKSNLDWLNNAAKKKPSVIEADVRSDNKKIETSVAAADAIFHFAGQVAVTTSVENPREDFEINALGTFNVLEALRKTSSRATFIYSSTNKVYGGLEDAVVLEEESKYSFKEYPLGISESHALDFHSPYGCSKGAADQYVRDYHRIYKLNTIVFRQSCIYGPRQFGIEDQGWVAWFIIAIMQGKKITVYGNGKQVRDLLYIDDLIRAYELAITHKEKTIGNIYNIGGGPTNTLAIWLEFKPLLETLFDKKIDAIFSDWRPGDQPIFVADIRKAKEDFNWSPKINVRQGIKKLYEWVSSHKELFHE